MSYFLNCVGHGINYIRYLIKIMNIMKLEEIVKRLAIKVPNAYVRLKDNSIMGPSSQIYRFTFDVSGINNCKNKTQKTVRYSFDVVFVNLGLGQSFNKITVLRTFLTFLLVKSVLINLQFCAMFIQNTSIVFLLLIFGIVITTGSTIFYLFT